ncbi:MAG: histidine kinase dimerization/phospho-acceptor domain-containing protein [Polyangiaceae bacterium]
MTRLFVSAGAAIGLILFVAFIAARLVRSRSQGMSIRMQVFLALAGIVGAFAFGLGLLVVDRIEARATLLAEGAAGDQAAAIATLLANEMATHDQQLEVLARHLGGPRAPGTPELHLSISDPAGRELFAEGPRSTDHVFMTAPIVVRGETVGTVRVGKPTIKIRQVLTDVAPAVLVSSIVLGIAAAIAAMRIGRAIAGPIEALTEFAVRVAEGDRRAVPPPAGGREVLRLSRSIDSMRRQLEGRPFVETFAADLSHELKNPVAAIRASAEVLADGALEEKEEAVRFVGRIQEATTRIEALLGDLLSLARIEARGVEEATRVDVAAVVRELARRERDGATVTVVAPAGADVRGDRAWMSRAIDNLIDNALRYGTPGAPVTVEVKRDGAEVHVSVTNAGAVDKNVAKRLFRRFVTTREGKGGTGLGLAIVRAIAEAHSGSATLVTGGPPEVILRVTLPAA